MHLLAYACMKLPFADDNVYSYLSLVFVVVERTWLTTVATSACGRSESLSLSTTLQNGSSQNSGVVTTKQLP